MSGNIAVVVQFEIGIHNPTIFPILYSRYIAKGYTVSLFLVFACIEAELLREIKLTQEGTLDGVESGASPSDVTGGMAGKLARACNIARLQIPVFVVNSGRDAYLACQEGAIGERGTRIIG